MKAKVKKKPRRTSPIETPPTFELFFQRLCVVRLRSPEIFAGLFPSVQQVPTTVGSKRKPTATSDAMTISEKDRYRIELRADFAAASLDEENPFHWRTLLEMHMWARRALLRTQRPRARTGPPTSWKEERLAQLLHDFCTARANPKLKWLSDEQIYAELAKLPRYENIAAQTIKSRVVQVSNIEKNSRLRWYYEHELRRSSSQTPSRNGKGRPSLKDPVLRSAAIRYAHELLTEPF